MSDIVYLGNQARELPPWAASREGGRGLLFYFDIAMRETRFAHEFYKSWAWRKCADKYKVSKGGLCERCMEKGLIVPGDEVHHKIRLTPENISDPAISLNWDNLELLCKNCHTEEHRPVRWRVDPSGHVDI